MNRINHGKFVTGIKEKANKVFGIDTGRFKTDDQLLFRERSNFRNELRKPGRVIIKSKGLNENNAVRIRGGCVMCGFGYINTDINHKKYLRKDGIHRTEPPEIIRVNLRDIKNRKSVLSSYKYLE